MKLHLIVVSDFYFFNFVIDFKTFIVVFLKSSYFTFLIVLLILSLLSSLSFFIIF
ncbi:hypothetical Protein pso3_09970 [Candidatus Phytoplasma solani]